MKQLGIIKVIKGIGWLCLIGIMAILAGIEYLFTKHD